MDFFILGASGMQGRIVTRDLMESGTFEICVSGRLAKDVAEIGARYPKVKTETLDLRDTNQIAALITRLRPKVVINCAEGDWNLEVYNAALAGGAHVVDLGSTIAVTKEQFAMHDAFAQKDLCAITGCGSTPGINNVALTRAAQEFDEVHTIEAGFAWDSNIKQFVVPFSMESVLEEFTELATALEQGVWVERMPLETIERRTFRDVGEQPCFLVRHSEPYTFHQQLKDRGLHTIRFFAGFPDHSFDMIRKLIRGVDITKGVPVEGEGVVPLGLLTQVLERRYPKPAGYEERENLWVIVTGTTAGGAPKRIMTECIVPPLSGWEDAGCNIDTGFPTSIIAQMILDGTITARGSFDPGIVVPPDQFFERLSRKGIQFYLDSVRIA